MKNAAKTILLAGLLAWGSSLSVKAQLDVRASTAPLTTTSPKKQKVVIITGNRFSYPLVQKWIDDYNAQNPTVQIIIESRGSADPAQYDILVEAYEPDEEMKKTREYFYIARYAVLPVANSKSAFAQTYADKGLNRDLIKQLFFEDMHAEEEKVQKIKTPYTVYTRLQKAGAPIIFTKYFGFEQKDIKGKVIAGSDEHLMKALLRDSTGITYLPLNLIYNPTTQKPNEGLTVLPVDINGNGKVSDEEKFHGDLAQVLQRLGEKSPKQLNNIPIGHLHFSVNKQEVSLEAQQFLQWVNENGQEDLQRFGFLNPLTKTP
jgi:ABC-type phosphate transport system substrate-binding protein